MNAKPYSFALVVAAAATILAASGCGPAGEARPDLMPVTGQLSINGKPASGAMLVFHPSSKVDFDARGTRPRATVEQDGHFQVTTYQSGDGIPVGDYDLSVLWFDNPDGSNPHDKLGGQYAVPERSNLHVTISDGTSELAPLEIKGARIVPRRRRSGSQDVDQVD